MKSRHFIILTTFAAAITAITGCNERSHKVVEEDKTYSDTPDTPKELIKDEAFIEPKSKNAREKALEFVERCEALYLEHLGRENPDKAVSDFNGLFSETTDYLNTIDADQRVNFWRVMMQQSDRLRFKFPGECDNTYKKMWKLLENAVNAYDERTMKKMPVNKTIRFVDKDGKAYLLKLDDNGDCFMGLENEGEPLNHGRWQSGRVREDADLMLWCRVSMPDSKRINNGGSRDYHNSNGGVFYPGDGTGEFYITPTKIWPSEISTDGTDGYERFTMTYKIVSSN